MTRILIALTIVMALVLSLGVVSVMANGPNGEKRVETEVTVQGGTTTPPIIKCKWEQDTTVDLEEGDPLHETAGAQFLPSLQYQVPTPVEYWVIVTDPEGVGTVSQVTVDVYHPSTAPPPYTGTFKYQVILTKVDKPTVGIPAYEAARDAGLVTYQTGYTDAEVTSELDKCTADVYMGEAELTYHQPAGLYDVYADACDTGNAWASTVGTDLYNQFEYLAGSGMEIDFEGVNYGAVEVCTNKWIAGDTVFDEPADSGVAPDEGPATVRNLGNVEIQLMVAQDDMGLGYSGVPPPTPATWNVEYDIRLGSNVANEVVYWPYKLSGDPDPDPIPMVLLPNKLTLCQTEELDFSIHVKKAMAIPYIGEMILAYQVDP
jgi:hypothetical protein